MTHAQEDLLLGIAFTLRELLKTTPNKVISISDGRNKINAECAADYLKSKIANVLKEREKAKVPIGFHKSVP